jgi:hypothetical protein
MTKFDMIPETATGNREVVWEILIFLNSEWFFFIFILFFMSGFIPSFAA